MYPFDQIMIKITGGAATVRRTNHAAKAGLTRTTGHGERGIDRAEAVVTGGTMIPGAGDRGGAVVLRKVDQGRAQRRQVREKVNGKGPAHADLPFGRSTCPRRRP
jgi:hypothetical protein